MEGKIENVAVTIASYARKMKEKHTVESNRNRKIYFDILKILAILSVFYVHTGADGMHYYETTKGLGHYVSFMLRELTHTCSYMFFMISGALLLGKEERLKVVLGKRVVRYGVLILLASLTRLIVYGLINGTPLTIMGVINGIYSTYVIEQYWFLHAYFAFLLLLPFLRLIAKGLKKNTALYLFGLMVVVNFILPYIEIALDLGPVSVSLPLLEDIIVLPLMGYCIDSILKETFESLRLRVWVYGLALLALAADLAYTYRMYMVGNVIPEMNGSYMVMTIGLFMLGRTLFSKIKWSKEEISSIDDSKVNKPVHETKKEKRPFSLASHLAMMGSSTLAIIVFEPEIREFTHPLYSVLKPYITWFPALAIWLIAALLVGTALSWVLKKIPGVKKLF